jgi:hypothetical protein
MAEYQTSISRVPEPRLEPLLPPPRPPTLTATNAGDVPEPHPGEIWSLGGRTDLTCRIIRANSNANQVHVTPLGFGSFATSVFLEQMFPLDFFVKREHLISR